MARARARTRAKRFQIATGKRGKKVYICIYIYLTREIQLERNESKINCIEWEGKKKGNRDKMQKMHWNKGRKRERERERETNVSRLHASKPSCISVGLVSTIFLVARWKTRGRTILCARMPEAFDLKRKREVIKGKTDFNSQRLAKERKKEQNKKKKEKKRKKEKKKGKEKTRSFFRFFSLSVF